MGLGLEMNTSSPSSPISCFEWQNRSSDYLDGTLIGAAQRQADEHLDTCQGCNERHKHYRLILTSIASQPRSSLPVPIRKAPFAAALPKLDLARLGRSRWEQVPWYVRTTLEGTGIVFLILLGISAGPRLRALYERSIERNLSDFTEALTQSGDSSTEGLNVPLSRGKAPWGAGASAGTAVAGGVDSEVAHAGDEFASEGNEEDDSSAEGSGAADTLEDGEVRVGSAEIWRFNLKTDSPHEFRPKVVQLLAELKIPAGTPGLGGIEAPGGIQFDLLLPQTVVSGLKKQLQKIAPPTPEGLANSPSGETFTWYKNKSKRPVPDGLTHVVIWLSQL
jgi:anti-sigma factor RsiW